MQHGEDEPCPHVHGTCRPSSLRNKLAHTPTSCAICHPGDRKRGKKLARSAGISATGDVELNTSLVICLKCGEAFCAYENDGDADHAAMHFQRKKNHAIFCYVTSLRCWCQGCDTELVPGSSEIVDTCVGLVRKLYSLPHHYIDASDMLLSHTPPSPTSTQNSQTTTGSRNAGVLAEVIGGVGRPVEDVASLASVARKATSQHFVSSYKSAARSLCWSNRLKGIINLGNTCYFNAVLQCLVRTIPLCEVHTAMQEEALRTITILPLDYESQTLGGQPIDVRLSPQLGPLTSKFFSYVDLMHDPTMHDLINPRHLQDEFSRRYPRFGDYREQQDSQEVLREFLGALEDEETARVKKAILQHFDIPCTSTSDAHFKQLPREHQAEVWAYVRGYQPRVDGAFRGTLKSTVQCLECSHESHAIEPFLDISVPIRTAPAPSPPKPKGGTSTGKSSGATRLFRGKLKGKSRQLDPGTEGSSEGDRKVSWAERRKQKAERKATQKKTKAEGKEKKKRGHSRNSSNASVGSTKSNDSGNNSNDDSFSLKSALSESGFVDMTVPDFMTSSITSNASADDVPAYTESSTAQLGGNGTEPTLNGTVGGAKVPITTITTDLDSLTHGPDSPAGYDPVSGVRTPHGMSMTPPTSTATTPTTACSDTPAADQTFLQRTPDVGVRSAIDVAAVLHSLDISEGGSCGVSRSGSVASGGGGADPLDDADELLGFEAVDMPSNMMLGVGNDAAAVERMRGCSPSSSQSSMSISSSPGRAPPSALNFDGTPTPVATGTAMRGDGAAPYRASAVTDTSPRKYIPKEGECSVESALAAMFSEEVLDGDDLFACESCYNAAENVSGGESQNNTEAEDDAASDSTSGGGTIMRRAKKRLAIQNTAQILTIHLKRFEQRGYSMSKVSRHVEFSPTLDLAPFCDETAPCNVYDDGEFGIRYELFAVVEHTGKLHSGHYTAFVKDTVECGTDSGESKWWHISDDVLTSCEEADVLKAQAYLLFYERLY